MSSRFAKARNAGQGGDVHKLAEALHRAAIGLLRGIKTADQETGLSPPRLSTLSVLVFAGPQSLASLAKAEGVKPPTMSKLVAELEHEGFVAKSADPHDRRGLVIAATAQGRRIMMRGRDRRLALLENRLARLNAKEIARLADVAPVLLKIAAREPAPAEGDV